MTVSVVGQAIVSIRESEAHRVASLVNPGFPGLAWCQKRSERRQPLYPGDFTLTKVAQSSERAVSQVSRPGRIQSFRRLPARNSALQQVWKPVLGQLRSLGLVAASQNCAKAPRSVVQTTTKESKVIRLTVSTIVI